MYTNDDLDRLRTISTAAISDALDTLSRKQLVIPPPIRLLAGKRIFGTAITVMAVGASGSSISMAWASRAPSGLAMAVRPSYFSRWRVRRISS